MVPRALSDTPRVLFLATRPEASADKSDNARETYHTLTNLLCFQLRSVHAY